MLVGEPILAQEVLVMGDEEETPRTPMNLGIRGVPTKTMRSLLLANLAEASEIAQLLGYVRLHIVIQQDERRLLRLALLASGHRLIGSVVNVHNNGSWGTQGAWMPRRG